MHVTVEEWCQFVDVLTDPECIAILLMHVLGGGAPPAWISAIKGSGSWVAAYFLWVSVSAEAFANPAEHIKVAGD